MSATGLAPVRPVPMSGEGPLTRARVSPTLAHARAEGALAALSSLSLAGQQHPSQIFQQPVAATGLAAAASRSGSGAVRSANSLSPERSNNRNARSPPLPLAQAPQVGEAAAAPPRPQAARAAAAPVARQPRATAFSRASSAYNTAVMDVDSDAQRAHQRALAVSEDFRGRAGGAFSAVSAGRGSSSSRGAAAAGSSNRPLTRSATSAFSPTQRGGRGAALLSLLGSDDTSTGANLSAVASSGSFGGGGGGGSSGSGSGVFLGSHTSTKRDRMNLMQTVSSAVFSGGNHAVAAEELRRTRAAAAQASTFPTTRSRYADDALAIETAAVNTSTFAAVRRYAAVESANSPLRVSDERTPLVDGSFEALMLVSEAPAGGDHATRQVDFFQGITRSRSARSRGAQSTSPTLARDGDGGALPPPPGGPAYQLSSPPTGVSPPEVDSLAGAATAVAVNCASGVAAAVETLGARGASALSPPTLFSSSPVKHLASASTSPSAVGNAPTVRAKPAARSAAGARAGAAVDQPPAAPARQLAATVLGGAFMRPASAALDLSPPRPAPAAASATAFESASTASTAASGSSGATSGAGSGGGSGGSADVGAGAADADYFDVGDVGLGGSLSLSPHGSKRRRKLDALPSVDDDDGGSGGGGVGGRSQAAVVPSPAAAPPVGMTRRSSPR